MRLAGLSSKERHEGIQHMSKDDRSCVIHIADAQSRIPGPAGERAATMFRRGTLEVKLSAHPLRPNRQTPHSQDEIYVIASGRGTLFHDGKRDPFEAGDCL